MKTLKNLLTLKKIIIFIAFTAVLNSCTDLELEEEQVQQNTIENTQATEDGSASDGSKD